MSIPLGGIALNPDEFAKEVASHYGSGYTVSSKGINAMVANSLERHPVTKGLSESTLKSEDAKWKAQVAKDADRIDSAEDDKAAAQKIVDKADDFLGKQNGYNTQKDAYNDANTKLQKAEASLAKAKSSKDKKALEATIKSDKKTLGNISASMKKISSSKDYQAELKKRSAALNAIESANKRISDWKSTKSKHKDTYNAFHAAYERSKAYYTRKLQKANEAKINAKINDTAANKYHGHTAVYREDLMEDRVFMLGEYSPSESNDQDVPLTTVDKGDPRSNYSVRNSKTMTGTYYIFGDSFEDCDKKYHDLQTWARKGIKVVLKGFARWKHCYMTNVSKSGDTPYKNALSCSITFSYVLEAPITYIKKKTKKKSKSKDTKKSGKNKSKTTTMRIPKGGTLYVTHKEIGAAVSYLKKLNPEGSMVQKDKWGRQIIKIGEN